MHASKLLIKDKLCIYVQVTDIEIIMGIDLHGVNTGSSVHIHGLQAYKTNVHPQSARCDTEVRSLERVYFES